MVTFSAVTGKSTTFKFKASHMTNCLPNIFLISSLITLYACNSDLKTGSESGLTSADTLEVIRRSDSATQAVIKNALFDTAGISQAPVKVLSAKLVKQEYSNRKDIRLAWKNVSGNKIAAIRFKWYGLNAFGEPADMGATGVIKGMGGGLADRSLTLVKQIQENGA